MLSLYLQTCYIFGNSLYLKPILICTIETAYDPPIKALGRLAT